MPDQSADRHEVIVIGGGQAGLAMGHFLARQGRRFAILEASAEPAAAWRARWDSLQLFTPARYDSLPGLAFPGDPDGYPIRDEVVAYLSDYAATSTCRSSWTAAVRSLAGRTAATWSTLDDRTLRSRPGRGGHRAVPGAATCRPSPSGSRRGLPAAQRRATARPRASRRDPCSSWAAATPASRSRRSWPASHEVHLSIGSRQTPLPQRLLGRDLFWWLTKIGLMRKTVDSRIGRRMQATATR